MSQHPFELTASQLQEMLNPEERLIMPPGADAPPEVIAGGTFLVEDERGQLPPPPGEARPEVIAEELATTERMGEEGGVEPGESRDVTTLAVGEEGGMQPRELPPPPDFPDATGILAEQGGFVSDPLPPVATPAVGEEEDELPPPILEGGEEEGSMEPRELPPPDFPEPTGILAEQGGVVSDPLPLATTEAVGEEGGGFTEVLAEQGEDPGMATTMAIGEEGGIVTRAEGEDGDTVFTFAEGENGEMRDFDEPMEPTTLAVGEEGGDVQIAEVQTFAGTEDDGNLEILTDAFGEPGGFNADVYGELYPQLIDAVNSGIIPSLLDHYEAFGQFEPERIGIFVGNFERPDIVTSFGNNTVISGIPIVGYDPIAGDFIFNGNGSGEFGFDILIGESSMTSTELFILGESQSQPFYVGSGDVDYALIQNFDVGSDRIQLSGFLEDYNFEVVNNSTNISTAAGDLVAVVENVTNIQDATLIFEGY